MDEYYDAGLDPDQRYGGHPDGSYPRQTHRFRSYKSEESTYNWEEKYSQQRKAKSAIRRQELEWVPISRPVAAERQYIYQAKMHHGHSSRGYPLYAPSHWGGLDMGMDTHVGQPYTQAVTDGKETTLRSQNTQGDLRETNEPQRATKNNSSDRKLVVSHTGRVNIRGNNGAAPPHIGVRPHGRRRVEQEPKNDERDQGAVGQHPPRHRQLGQNNDDGGNALMTNGALGDAQVGCWLISRMAWVFESFSQRWPEALVITCTGVVCAVPEWAVYKLCDIASKIAVKSLSIIALLTKAFVFASPQVVIVTVALGALCGMWLTAELAWSAMLCSAPPR
jgi:hypothetical protein